MHSQPIFRPSVFANHVFTTTEVNVSKKRIFQPNVFNTNRAFTPAFYPPAVFSRAFNHIAFQSSWALAKTQATENVGITEPTSQTVMGKVRTVATAIVGITEGSAFMTGIYAVIADPNIIISEANNRSRDIARIIGEQINISQFSGRFRYVSRIIA